MEHLCAIKKEIISDDQEGIGVLLPGSLNISVFKKYRVFP